MMFGGLLRVGLAVAVVLVLSPSSIASGQLSLFGQGLSTNGDACLACTIFIGFWRQIMQVYHMNSTEAIDYYIHLFPPKWVTLFEALEPQLVTKYAGLLSSNATPDAACYGGGFCVVDPGYHYCHLWPLPAEGMETAVHNAKAENLFQPMTSLCDNEQFAELCSLLSVGNPVVLDDPDGDNFTTNPTLRGYAWRGQDCAENNSNIYPGRLPINSDRDYDSNCNGIWGVNPVSGNAYEDELCGGQSNYGLIYIGDSIGASFHLPADWLRANVVSADLMSNFTFVVENELDWPHMSWGTGFVNSSWPITVDTPTNSIYYRLRSRNLCNHRDYQNLAFNGARSFTMMDSVPSMTRDEGRDKPVIVIYAAFGNDICRSHHGNISEMTSVQQFNDSVYETLNYLESRIPSNSHVFLTGLVNGTYLYTILKGRIHPLGEINNDVTYDDVYNFFSCMQTVCPAWTNTNPDEQKMATDYAMQLSSVLVDIAAQATYNRFQLHYLDCPMERAFSLWTGEMYELIEPMDGLHPSKHGQDMFAEAAWEALTSQFADVLGPVNPNNDLIVQLFGDQGGH